MVTSTVVAKMNEETIDALIGLLPGCSFIREISAARPVARNSVMYKNERYAMQKKERSKFLPRKIIRILFAMQCRQTA